MESHKAFREGDVVGICNYLTYYCNNYINAVHTLLNEHASDLYSYLPTLLIYIFGSPSKRGWVQSELRPDQDSAIRHLLSPHGPFFNSLLRLSKHSEYTYLISTDQLPEDVRKALGAGAIQFLPDVYRQNAVYDVSDKAKLQDIRTAATQQSKLFPRSNVGAHQIMFNALQFFLYYSVSTLSWGTANPTPSTPLQNGTSSFQATNMAPSVLNKTSNVYSNTLLPPSGSSSLSSHSTFPATRPEPQRPSPAVAALNDPLSTPTSRFQAYGQPRRLTQGIYADLMNEYTRYFIPIGHGRFHPDVHTFFLDCCIELWIRTTWIPRSQRVNPEIFHFIQMLVKHVLQGDLRLAVGSVPSAFNSQHLDYKVVYNAVKHDLYALISRLAINWTKNTTFSQVVDLWALWAAPWWFGQLPREYDDGASRPAYEGWGLCIIDNALFYFPLEEIILQRTSEFRYSPRSSLPVTSSAMGSQTSAMDAHSLYMKQLQIIMRILTVMKAAGLTDILALVETGFGKIRAESSKTIAKYTHDYFDPLVFGVLVQVCNRSVSEHQVQSMLRQRYDQLSELDDHGNWSPRYIYMHDQNHPRAKCLVNTLDAIYDAIYDMEMPEPPPTAAGLMSPVIPTQTQPPMTADQVQATPFNQKRNNELLNQLKSVAEQFALVFQLPNLDAWLKQSKHNAASKLYDTVLSRSVSKDDQGWTSSFRLGQTMPSQATIAPTPVPGTATAATTTTATTATTATTTTATATAPSSNPVSLSTIREVGLSNNGYLTEEEKQLIREGKAFCSRTHIPILGPRADQLVHPHEIGFLVPWSISFDRWLNQQYWALIPPGTPLMPHRLSTRLITSRNNLFVLVAFLCILLLWRW